MPHFLLLGGATPKTKLTSVFTPIWKAGSLAASWVPQSDFFERERERQRQRQRVRRDRQMERMKTGAKTKQRKTKTKKNWEEIKK